MDLLDPGAHRRSVCPGFGEGGASARLDLRASDYADIRRLTTQLLRRDPAGLSRGALEALFAEGNFSLPLYRFFPAFEEGVAPSFHPQDMRDILMAGFLDGDFASPWHGYDWKELAARFPGGFLYDRVPAGYEWPAQGSCSIGFTYGSRGIEDVGLGIRQQRVDRGASYSHRLNLDSSGVIIGGLNLGGRDGFIFVYYAPPAFDAGPADRGYELRFSVADFRVTSAAAIPLREENGRTVTVPDEGDYCARHDRIRF